MVGYDGNLRLREAWKHTLRGYGIVRKLAPSFIPLSACKALLNSVQPLAVLYITAQILNELAGARDVNRIVVYVIATVLLTYLLSVARAIVTSKLTVIESTFYQRVYFFHGDRYMQFDFEHVEKSKTNEALADIEAKINGNGLGLPQLCWSFPAIVENLLGSIASGLLLIGMFTTAREYRATFATSPLATVLLCLLIALVLILTFSLRRREQTVLKKVFEDTPKANSFFFYYYDYVQAGKAGKDIRLYHQQPAILEILNHWMNVNPWHSYCRFEGKLGGLTAAANALVGGCVYLFIGLRALAGMYGIGSVLQYVGAVTSLVNHFTAFLTESGKLYTNSQYLVSLYEYLDLPDEKYKGTLTTEKRADHDYAIEFHDVSFRYPGTDRWALRNLSLKFHVGERLAVVGMNGSGKTTMIKLLCRLYDPTEGEITLNGINIKKYEYDEYMSLFSVVFQDFKLFSLPLGQNVAASADVDSAKAESSLLKAGFGERLNGLPQRLDTCLYKDFSEDGTQISGGEAQKIALARALYKNAPFIVLDEPTAALDPLSEFEVYSKFNEIIGGKTAIFISHRLSSCRFCQDIAVFHEGRLIQRGGHDELLADAGGKYRELWNAQAQYYVEKEAI